MSRDYSSVRSIMTRDYEAMYAYKCGLYEMCFHLSDENVKFLLYTEDSRITRVLRVKGSDLFLLTDDDCLSLINLARFCGVFDIDLSSGETVVQLTLSMFLLIQSKLRLRHYMTSLIDSLRVIQRVHDSNEEGRIINRAKNDGVYLP